MLEGKELEGGIGSVGKYELDVDASGKVKAMVGLEFDIVVELEKLAARTDNKIDDSMVAMIKSALGR